MAAAHKDARHAEWLLERQFPRSFAPYDRRPIPQETQPAFVRFPATLPNGKEVDAAELLQLVSQFRAQEAQPREQPAETEPTGNEEMTHWYNPITRRIEPTEPRDNGEQEIP